MELKLDRSKTYAIALEGGGAKGAYEIGVWKALDEAGIRFNAISGTSVGALNGAMMAMGDLPRAEAVWEDMRLSKVINLSTEEEKDMSGLLNADFNLHSLLSGETDLTAIRELLPKIIRGRGLDVTPLHEWVREIVDPEVVRQAGIELYISTVSITDRKALEIRVDQMPGDEMCDMLLASAYHPTFRLEKLGGKLYADGGFADSLPLHPLVERGYKDIIAVRIPGMGIERRFKMPDDVNVTTIAPTGDLGGVLNFDAVQSRRDLRLGYLDAQRVLYGLCGSRYYIERTLSEYEALNILLGRIFLKAHDANLRPVLEKEIPAAAKQYDKSGESYYDLLIALLERRATAANLTRSRIYTDAELIGELLK